jgi:hypothetical protein
MRHDEAVTEGNSHAQGWCGVSPCTAMNCGRGQRHHALRRVAWLQLLWDVNDRPETPAMPWPGRGPLPLGDQPTDQWDAKQLGEYIFRLKHSTAEPEYQQGYKAGKQDPDVDRRREHHIYSRE